MQWSVIDLDIEHSVASSASKTSTDVKYPLTACLIFRFREATTRN